MLEQHVVALICRIVLAQDVCGQPAHGDLSNLHMKSRENLSQHMIADVSLFQGMSTKSREQSQFLLDLLCSCAIVHHSASKS